MHGILDTIRKYPWFTYLLIFVNVAVFSMIELSGQSTHNILDLMDWGANFNPFTFDNEWWRLFSSMFLHVGWIHLVVNMYSLYNLGTYVESSFGRQAFIITYFVTGLVGSIASGYFNLFVVSAGASGAIFGIYGFYIIQVLVNQWDNKQALLKAAVSFVLYVVVITWIGTKANFDNAAHIGGLVAGIVISLLDATFNNKRTHVIYPNILIVSALLIFTAYFQMPRFQVKYYNMYQSFLNAEVDTIDKINSRYDSDLLMAEEMGKLIFYWDTVKYKLDSLPKLPKVLSNDRNLINIYLRLRQDELNFIIKGIKKESYIYMDSLDVVRTEMKMLPPLSFYLNYKRPDIDTTKSSPPPPKRELIKLFYDSLWKECDPLKSYYYRLGFKDSLDRWDGFVRDFFENGGIQMKGKYAAGLRDGIFLYYNEDSTYSGAGRFKEDFRVGKWEQFYVGGIKQADIRYEQGWAYVINTWDSVGNPMVIQGNGEDVHKYVNGIIASYTNYIDGRIVDESFGYHKNGDPYFKEYYVDGILSYGISYSSTGSQNEYDISTFIPHPEGGDDAYQLYIENNKVYPNEAMVNSIIGDLDLIFTVYPDGTIGDIRILNYLGYGCEEEAIRLLMEGWNWIPAKLHGTKPIVSQSRIRISFP